jgi:hypothetical protein
MSFTGGSLTLGAVFLGRPSGTFTTNGATTPFLSLNTGTYGISSVSGLTTAFSLLGLNTAGEVADGVPLTVGTDQLLSHGGTLVDATSATVNAHSGVIIDTALFNATAPLLHLKSGSTLTTSVDALDLVQRAKLTSVGPVFKLDASTLTVNSGALALVRNGSLLRVTGDFLQLSNASTLSLLNGAVLNVTGNSVVNISGAFVNFGGTGGNAINVNNALCGGPCANIGGLNVNLVGGAVAANVSITNPIKNGALGAINAGANTAVISVSGANSKVTISGN